MKKGEPFSCYHCQVLPYFFGLSITRFEYIKRANKGKGPVLIGIALSDKNDYDGLLERLSAFDPSYINLHGNETLYNMLV